MVVGTLDKNKVQLIAVYSGGGYVDRLGDNSDFIQGSNFLHGSLGWVILQDNNGKLSLATKTVRSAEEAVEVAEKYKTQGKQLADVSIVGERALSAFMHHFSGAILVFGDSGSQTEQSTEKNDTLREPQRSV